jgi:hypothetical protein
MMAFAIPAALLVVLPTPATSASLPLAERIFQAAIAAPAQTGEGRLYSYRIWTPSTKKKIGPLTYDGFLSCAIVVSAILKEAGHDIGKQYSVDGIARALHNWPTVKAIEDLRNGDVVFWKASETKAALFWRLGIYPRGQYPQHVGIYVGKDEGKPMTVDNNSSTGKPEKTTLDRMGNVFSFAKRPK